MVFLYSVMALAYSSILGAQAISSASRIEKKGVLYMTEISPPDKFIKEDKLVGLFVETLKLIWTDLGIEGEEIQIFPWARAYQNLLDKPDTILFSIAKTKEREGLFKWAGPLRKTRLVLIAKKNKSITLKDMSAKSLSAYRLGSVTNDAAEQLLVSRGHELKNLDRSEAFRSLILKLISDRVDIVTYGEMPFFAYVRENALNPHDFEVIAVLEEVELYYGFNKNTPMERVKDFQAALDRVKASKKFKTVLDTYYIPQGSRIP